GSRRRCMRRHLHLLPGYWSGSGRCGQFQEFASIHGCWARHGKRLAGTFVSRAVGGRLQDNKGCSGPAKPPYIIDRWMPLLFCLVFPLLAASLSAYRLPIKVYTTAHGLPRNSARCIVPDSNGLLWLCTSEGLVRFDGYQFAIFGPEHGLPSRSILDFVLSRKGGYWVVTDAGVCRLPAGSK